MRMGKILGYVASLLFRTPHGKISMNYCASGADISSFDCVDYYRDDLGGNLYCAFG